MSENLEKALDYLTAYDESCDDDTCQCCVTWRCLIREVVAIAERGEL